MPRYTNWTQLRRQRWVVLGCFWTGWYGAASGQTWGSMAEWIVGVTVMDIDLQEIDFNACDVGVGNRGPSYLSGIHKCPKYSVVRVSVLPT
ncbi:hypothetical protein ElyMa_004741400 [Elysia marginata]|uniref:Secreted protein n=1 Tax=Elysia marginata TaxID=1093978 RepID=A0AAV4IHS1_9GAST|nr:hypothetical protein ElyMa_004741400 [Elysia marginata]